MKLTGLIQLRSRLWLVRDTTDSLLFTLKINRSVRAPYKKYGIWVSPIYKIYK